MCQMLLSINPEHVENIINGSKQFEYRKFRCKSDVDKILIYSTAPEKKIVAEADITEIIEGDINYVWKHTKNHAGISYEFFQEYYKDKEKAVAYRLGNIAEYTEPRTLSYYGLTHPPQSFRYLSD